MKPEPQLGLRENWKQFTLLVVINAFVGGMVGLERSIFPQYAETIFGVTSKTAMLSFITAFGISKALANYYTGRMANVMGRKRLLVLGWGIALPVPLILMSAGHWNWVVFANILLGVSQGLTWSSTVVMKIDLAGPRQRGLAMGLNEFSGYLAVGLVAFLSGFLASRFGLVPYPFYLGVFLAVTGLLLSLIWVRDTRGFVHQETRTDQTRALEHVFWDTTLRHRTLSSVTQAGLVNNLNDGMIWGLFPALLYLKDFDLAQIGVLTAIYPAVWGLGQIATGKMSDHIDFKKMLFWGMLLQALAIAFLPPSGGFWLLALLAGLLGIGTALVYPTFLNAIASATPPKQRAESVGVFRLWRDLGYAFGAVISGITADLFGLEAAIWLTAGLTLLSAGVIALRMPGAGRPT